MPGLARRRGCGIGGDGAVAREEARVALVPTQHLIGRLRLAPARAGQGVRRTPPRCGLADASKQSSLPLSWAPGMLCCTSTGRSSTGASHFRMRGVLARCEARFSRRGASPQPMSGAGGEGALAASGRGRYAATSAPQIATPAPARHPRRHAIGPRRQLARLVWCLADLGAPPASAEWAWRMDAVCAAAAHRT
jgi:hypothetical protein